MKELIENAQHIVIFTHMAPDGDAMGSSLALWHHIKVQSDKVQCTKDDQCTKDKVQCTKEGNAGLTTRAGNEGTKDDQCTKDKVQGTKDVTVMVPNAYPAFLGWMPGADKIMIYETHPRQCDELIAKADLFICTDFNDPKRIGPMGGKMLASPAKKILIDHHLKVQSTREGQCTKDNVQSTKDGNAGLTTRAGNEGTKDDGQGTKEWYMEEHVDSNASSSCEIVYKLLRSEGTSEWTTEIATCLYTGLMTDTGNFSYNSTNAELYDMIASLIRAGVKKDEIYNAVFNQFSTDRMRLTGYALYRKMRIFPEYHLSLITLSADELDQYHYQPGDCEGIVNMPLQIADVYYSVIMREERAKPGTPKSRIRISFRSQGDRPVNVWASEVFHGGGHMNASGGEVLGSIPYAVKVFENSYKKYLKKE